MAAHNLEQYIQQLQTPVMEFRDPEDDTDDTSARLAPAPLTEDSTESSPQFSTLRRRAAAYNNVSGKKTSRKELYGDSGSSGEEDAHSDEVDEEDDGEEVGDETDAGELGEADGEGDEGDEVKGEEEDGEEGDDLQESEEDDVESGGGDGGSDEEITSEESEEEEVIPKTAIDEGEKAHAVVQQLDLWDRLMEVRIQLQKVLCLANRLPPPPPPPPQPQPADHASPLRAEAGNVLHKINRTLYDVQNHPSSPKKRKRDDVDVEELTQESYLSLVKARNTTLTFWDEKTRLGAKKSFKSYQTPVVKQVEQILSDRDRLLRRTQVIRGSEASGVCEKPEEVFDDTDFYQRLLKNLIDSKASEQTSLSASASQWIEVQRLRGNKKKKRDVDTKGQQRTQAEVCIQYNVHSKVVNFMAPRDDAVWSEDARSELFKNLFKMPCQSEM